MCAVTISFSYQKNKEDEFKFVVHQTFFSNKTFAHYSFFVTEFKKFYSNQIFDLLYLFQPLSLLQKSKVHGAPLGNQLFNAK